MSKLRRYKSASNQYFITSVTFERQPLCAGNEDLVLSALEAARRHSRFDVIAWAILPDHVHLMLEVHDRDVSTAMQRFKLSFGRLWRKRTNGVGRVWQHRFWDHILRDQEDFNRHVDYVHINPVKHGLSDTPSKWKWSSIHEFMEAGLLDPNWSPLGLDEWAKGREFGES